MEIAVGATACVRCMEVVCISECLLLEVLLSIYVPFSPYTCICQWAHHTHVCIIIACQRYLARRVRVNTDKMAHACQALQLKPKTKQGKLTTSSSQGEIEITHDRRPTCQKRDKGRLDRLKSCGLLLNWNRPHI